MPSLFVSRSLAPDSPLRKWAGERGYNLRATSLIQFSLLKFDPPSEQVDWIFFYSPKAVDFWSRGLKKPLAFQPKFAALGPGTAKALLQLNHRIDFCGQGDPTRVADDFLTVALGQVVLFPRAVQSRRSVEKCIGDYINAIDLIVYTNEAAPRTDLVATDVVILTSPLNVAAYFSSTLINHDAIFLAIGSTTAAALAEYTIQADFPDQPGEAGLVELLNSIVPPI